MKKLLLSIIFLFVLMGCNNKYVIPKELIVKNSMSYKIGEKEPYTGIVKKFNNDGKLKDKIYYKNGKIEKSKWFSIKGHLIAEIYWENGKEIQKYYDGNGNLIVEESF